MGGIYGPIPFARAFFDGGCGKETRAYIRPLGEEWKTPRAPMESALLLLIRSTASNAAPPPSGSEEAGLSHLRHLRRLEHLDRKVCPNSSSRAVEKWKT